MFTKRICIISGLVLILVAMLVTGASYAEHGNLSKELMIASAACVVGGLAMVFLSSYLKK